MNRKQIIQKMAEDFSVPAENRGNLEKVVTALNAYARQKGTNKVTWVARNDTLDAEKIQVTHFDPYHAESRTGIRAKMAALKRFWSTYHYVPTSFEVAVSKAFVDKLL